MAPSHDADLDGKCENCGLLIGFHGTHTTDECVAALKESLKIATAAMYEALSVSQDRQAFVMLGSRAFAKAEDALREALNKLGLRTER